MRDFEITSFGSDGESAKLLFNETIVLLHKNDVVNFVLPVEANKWKMQLHFVDDPQLEALTSTWTVANNIITIQFNKWYSDTWVESTSPYEFSSTDGKLKLKVKIRTSANIIDNFRTLMISIWKIS